MLPKSAISNVRLLRVRVQETAQYTLQARWGSAGAPPLCPGNCGGASAGACVAPGTCRCASSGGAGRGGLWCEGPLALLPFGAQQRGTLAPGDWAYYEVRVEPPSAYLTPTLTLA